MTSVRPLDRETLKREYRAAQPFPFIRIDDLLEPAFAAEVARAYPSFEHATTREGLGEYEQVLVDGFPLESLQPWRPPE